jgi:hypothetical protein
MRQFTIGVLCSAAFLASAACNKSPENQAPEAVNAGSDEAAGTDKYYTVNALPVPDARITALQGKFKMVEAGAADGIPSDGTGGACLVFAAADLGYPAMAAKSCTTNKSCATGEIGTDGTAASATYCDGKTHSCWAKPGSNGAALALCNKGIKMKPDDLNFAPADPPAGKGPIDAGKWVKPGAQVRVVACLQRIDAVKGPGGNGCPTVDGDARIEVMGPVANVKK